MIQILLYKYCYTITAIQVLLYKYCYKSIAIRVLLALHLCKIRPPPFHLIKSLGQDIRLTATRSDWQKTNITLERLPVIRYPIWLLVELLSQRMKKRPKRIYLSNLFADIYLP